MPPVHIGGGSIGGLYPPVWHAIYCKTKAVAALQMDQDRKGQKGHLTL